MPMQKGNFKKYEAKVKSAEKSRKKKEQDEIQAEIIKSELAKENSLQTEPVKFEPIVSEVKQDMESKILPEVNFTPDHETIKMIIDLTAQKIVAAFFEGRMGYSGEDLTKDLVNLIRSITKQDIVSKIFENLDCPMIYVPGWDDCGGNTPGSQEKCHDGGFVKCQHWTGYLIYRTTTRAKQFKEKK